MASLAAISGANAQQPQVMRVGGPVPNPANMNGSTDYDNLGIGYPTNSAPENGKFDSMEKPVPQINSGMRVINPDRPNNLGYWPDNNGKNNVDTLRRKTYGL